MKKILLAFVCLFMSSVYGKDHKAPHYLYDAQHVRYEHYREGVDYNWIFLPGGPGADSSYLRTLIDELELPGNVWLVDLPGNGGNVDDSFSENYEQWSDCFLKIIAQFENPILVGHSFGGMFPLLFPEMENYLKGFIILNSAPVLWQQEAINYAKQFDLPDFSKDLQEFALNPNQDRFNAVIDTCMPYYFPKETLEKGRQLLAQFTFRWQPCVWWLQKASEINFSAKWIPQNIPTLIIGSKYDCMCPFSLFKNDDRFHRQNIRLLFIENAGHFPWIENPVAVREAFDAFCSQLDKMALAVRSPDSHAASIVPGTSAKIEACSPAK